MEHCPPKAIRVLFLRNAPRLRCSVVPAAPVLDGIDSECTPVHGPLNSGRRGQANRVVPSAECRCQYTGHQREVHARPSVPFSHARHVALEGVRFAADSPLERTRFEPSVPRDRPAI